MVKIVLDTSVIIDYLRRDEGWLGETMRSRTLEEYEVLLPAVVLTELWAGESMEEKLKVAVVEKLISKFRIIVIDDKMAILAGDLVRENKIEAMDGIIAAAAIENDAMLVTNNIKHFSNIKGLRLYKK